MREARWDTTDEAEFEEDVRTCPECGILYLSTGIWGECPICADTALDDESKVQQENNDTSICAHCAENFLFLRSPFVCSKCGLTVCDQCSSPASDLTYDYETDKLVHVCKECAPRSRRTQRGIAEAATTAEEAARPSKDTTSEEGEDEQEEVQAWTNFMSVKTSTAARAVGGQLRKQEFQRANAPMQATLHDGARHSKAKQKSKIRTRKPKAILRNQCTECQQFERKEASTEYVECLFRGELPPFVISMLDRKQKTFDAATCGRFILMDARGRSIRLKGAANMWSYEDGVAECDICGNLRPCDKVVGCKECSFDMCLTCYRARAKPKPIEPASKASSFYAQLHEALPKIKPKEAHSRKGRTCWQEEEARQAIKDRKLSGRMVAPELPEGHRNYRPPKQ